MDFSTIKVKLNANKYNTLKCFIRDFELMCKNAMSFNSPDNMCHKVIRLSQMASVQFSPYFTVEYWPLISITFF